MAGCLLAKDVVNAAAAVVVLVAGDSFFQAGFAACKREKEEADKPNAARTWMQIAQSGAVLTAAVKKLPLSVRGSSAAKNNKVATKVRKRKNRRSTTKTTQNYSWMHHSCRTMRCLKNSHRCHHC